MRSLEFIERSKCHTQLDWGSRKFIYKLIFESTDTPIYSQYIIPCGAKYQIVEVLNGKVTKINHYFRYTYNYKSVGVN